MISSQHNGNLYIPFSKSVLSLESKNWTSLTFSLCLDFLFCEAFCMDRKKQQSKGTASREYDGCTSLIYRWRGQIFQSDNISFFRCLVYPLFIFRYDPVQETFDFVPYNQRCAFDDSIIQIFFHIIYGTHFEYLHANPSFWKQAEMVQLN